MKTTYICLAIGAALTAAAYGMVQILSAPGYSLRDDGGYPLGGLLVFGILGISCLFAGLMELGHKIKESRRA
jgi:hypothetical protein